MATARPKLAASPCFKKIPLLVHQESGAASPITQDIQSYMKEYGMSVQDAVRKAVTDTIKERDAVQKVLDAHAESVKPAPAAKFKVSQDHPVDNSEGRQIHATTDGIKNFWGWFKGSKAVDDQGRPTVMYHGTTRDISAFGDASRDIFLANTAHDANGFAQLRGPDGENIMPVYVNVRNPFDFRNAGNVAKLEAELPDQTYHVYDLYKDDHLERSKSELVEMIKYGDFGAIENTVVRNTVKSLGHDGYFVHENAISPAELARFKKNLSKPDKEWMHETETNLPNLAVFSSDQVKSVTGNNGAFDGKNPDTRFSVGDGRSEPVDHQYAEDQVKLLASNMPSAPEFKMVNESEAPKATREEIKSLGAEGKVKGALIDGKVYIFKDNLKNNDEAVEVFLHEAVGHFGLRKMLGPDFDTVLGQIAKSIPRSDLADIARDYKLDLNKHEDLLDATEEKLSQGAEKGEKPALMAKVISAVRAWLREHGFENLKWSDDDIAHLISQSRGHLERTPEQASLLFDGNHFMVASPRSIRPITLENRLFDGDRSAAHDWILNAKNNVIGDHPNSDTRTTISVSKRILERKATSGKAIGKSDDAADHLEILRALPELIRKAILVKTEGDKNSDTNIKDVNRFVVPVQVGDKFYAVKLTVKNYVDSATGNKYYTHELIDIEMPSVITPKRLSGEPENNLRKTDGTYEFSVSDLVDAVNNKDIAAGELPSLSGAKFSIRPDEIPDAHKEEFNRHLAAADKAIESGDEKAAGEALDKAEAMYESFKPKPAAAVVPPVQAEMKPETPKEDQRTTAVKNAVTEEEQGPLDKWKFTREGIMAEGKAMVDNDIINPRELVKRVLKDPHTPMTAEEQAALLYDRTKLHNEHEAMTEKLLQATESGNEIDRIEALDQRERIENELYDNAQAATFIGTSWSAFGHARQAVMAQDYSLSWSLQRLKAATGKRDVPEDLRVHLEKLTQELQSAVSRSEEYEARIKELEAARVVKTVVERTRLTERPTSRSSAAKKEASREFTNLANQLRKTLGRINMSLDPTAVVILGKMMQQKIIEGVKDVVQIVDDIKLELSDTPELEKRDIRDAISDYGKTSKLSQDEISIDIREAKRQMKLISGLEDALGGDAPLRSGMQRDPISDEVRELQRQIKDAMRESGIDDKSARSPEEQRKTAADGIKTRLKNEIFDLNKQILSGKRTVKDRKSIEYDTETKALKAIRDEKKALLDEIDAKPPKSEDEIQKVALRAYKTRTAARIIELERKLATGDFETKARRVLKMDPEAMAMKDDVAKAKQNVDIAIREQQLKNRTKVEKGVDYFLKVRRATILSGTGTGLKLSMAATMRFIVTPMEEAVGSAIRHIPGLSKIDAMAPREGGGLNVTAEAAALVQIFRKESYKDIWSVRKTGVSSLDRLFGGKHDSPPEVIELFGRIHGALKVMPKRAEFFRSMQKRTEWSIRQGLDITDPSVVATITAGAYIDAQRAIFMSENYITTSHRMMLSYLKNKGGAGGYTLATIVQALLPIVKVPTNFVAETSSYFVGGAKAAVAARHGMRDMTPERADYIMRALKKQGLGAAVFLLGAAFSSAVGGYYEQGEKKRGLKDVKAKGLRIYDWDVPKLLLHTPLLEMLQMGATYQRTVDHYAEWNKDPKHKDNKKEDAVKAALQASSWGLFEEVPFIKTPATAVKAMGTSKGADKFVSEFVKSLIIPPDFNRAAKSGDMAGEELIPREQKSLGQILKGGIPGMRNDLPVDVAAFKRLPLSRATEVYDNAPPSLKVTLGPAYRAKRMAEYRSKHAESPY